MAGQRTDVISWDEFFMRVAVAASLRSKDPNTQVGACIAGADNRILSVGYNGTPAGVTDDAFPWETSDDPILDKHSYVIHAEMNAVLNYRGNLRDMQGSTVYVTLFPCQECAKTLAQVGVSEVVYLDNKYSDTIGHKVSRAVLEQCGVRFRQFGGSLGSVGPRSSSMSAASRGVVVNDIPSDFGVDGSDECPGISEDALSLFPTTRTVPLTSVRSVYGSPANAYELCRHLDSILFGGLSALRSPSDDEGTPHVYGLGTGDGPSDVDRIFITVYAGAPEPDEDSVIATYMAYMTMAGYVKLERIRVSVGLSGAEDARGPHGTLSWDEASEMKALDIWQRYVR